MLLFSAKNRLFKRKMKNNTPEDLADGLAKDRDERIQQENHLTGYNALVKLWKNNEEAHDALEMMGYGSRALGTARLQSDCLALPGKRKERQDALVQTRVGGSRFTEPKVSATTEERACTLLRFCYGPSLDRAA